MYAEAANYTAYTMETEHTGTSFSLVNPDTVQQTLTDSAACLVPTVDASKDYSWNRSHVATALTKGVLLGESIPKIAKRMEKVADMGRSAAVRTARTAITGAENAGRLDMVRRAEAMGLDVELEWIATLDGRTRHSHRAVDGEKVRSGKKFSNGCRYPGDPQAPYAEICNCRCTLGYVVGGVGTEDAKRAEKLGGMSYAEWKAGKRAERNRDDLASAVLSSKAEAKAYVVRNAVGKMVQLGCENGKSVTDYLDLGGMGKQAAKLFEKAATYVPMWMLETLRAGGVKAVRDLKLDRSFYEGGTKTINIGRDADQLTIVHEMMHAIEQNDPSFLAEENVYFSSRTAGKQRARLRDLTGNDAYRDYEKAYDLGGRCIDPYAFKIYRGGSYYELMSMGVETLYRTPSAYLKDPGMLKWTLKMLEG